MTLAEIKIAEEREPPSPRQLNQRIYQLQKIVGLVKKNHRLGLNDNMDLLLDDQLAIIKSDNKKA